MREGCKSDAEVVWIALRLNAKSLVVPSHIFGSLAQLVQSICLTSRGSAVRIRQLPLQKNGCDNSQPFFEEFAKNGLEGKVWQYFTAVPDFRSVPCRFCDRTFPEGIIRRDAPGFRFFHGTDTSIKVNNQTFSGMRIVQPGI